MKNSVKTSLVALLLGVKLAFPIAENPVPYSRRSPDPAPTVAVVAAPLPGDAHESVENAESRGTDGTYGWSVRQPGHSVIKHLRPTRLFAADKVTIDVRDDEQAGPSATLTNLITNDSYTLKTSTKRSTDFTVKLPHDIPAGAYSLDFTTTPLAAGPGTISVPRSVILPVERTLHTVAQDTTPFDPNITRLGYGDGYWESAMIQDPANPENGILLGCGSDRGSFMTTRDGWKTAQKHNLNERSTPFDPDHPADLTQPVRNFLGDPELAFLPDGRLIIAGMTYSNNPLLTDGVWTAEGHDLSGPFVQRIMQPREGAPADIDLVFDYPKLAVDDDPSSPWFGSVYIPANAVWFPEKGHRQMGLYTIRDGKIRKTYGPEIGIPQPPQSAVTLDGTLYLARDEWDYNNLHTSTDGGASFTTMAIPTGAPERRGIASIARGNPRDWILFRGPVLAVDKERDILYLGWGRPKAVVDDPNFRYPENLGVDFDVLLSASYDRGKSWTQPVRINDDQSGGDQGYLSLAVDTDGTLYASWFDHRDRQDEPVFDVYLAHSKDFGKSFSRNRKVNDQPVPNTFGGRNPGDYRRDLAVGKDAVYVSHPCVGENYDPYVPTDTCVSRIIKPSERRRPVRR